MSRIEQSRDYVQHAILAEEIGGVLMRTIEDSFGSIRQASIPFAGLVEITPVAGARALMRYCTEGDLAKLSPLRKTYGSNSYVTTLRQVEAIYGEDMLNLGLEHEIVKKTWEINPDVRVNGITKETSID